MPTWKNYHEGSTKGRINMIRYFRNIKWPWTKRLDEVETRFLHEAEMIKRALEKKRIVNFVHVIQYHEGMTLSYEDERPKPILLEDLEKRIKALESALDMDVKEKGV